MPFYLGNYYGHAIVIHSFSSAAYWAYPRGWGYRDTTERTGDSTLVYGEITFKTLALALHKIKAKYGLPGVGHSGDAGILQEPGGVFYDIGSGTGKPVRAVKPREERHCTVGSVCVLRVESAVLSREPSGV